MLYTIDPGFFRDFSAFCGGVLGIPPGPLADGVGRPRFVWCSVRIRCLLATGPLPYQRALESSALCLPSQSVHLCPMSHAFRVDV